MNKITKEQLEELEEARSCSFISDFNDLLEDYTGIKAVPYTAFQYYDSADNFVGDSDNYDVREILENAYIICKGVTTMPNEFNVGDCVASKVCPTMIGMVTDIVCHYGEIGLVVKVSDREILADRNFWKKVKNNAE